MPGFLKLLLSGTSVCVVVCLPLRLLITSSMILSPYDWLNKFYNFYMAAVVRLDGKCGLRTEAHYRNQLSITKLALYAHHINLYISNKMERIAR